MKVEAAIQNAFQWYCVIYDEKKRDTSRTSLDHFSNRDDRIKSSKESEPVPSMVSKYKISAFCLYCWWSFSSTISHLVSLLQSVTPLAFSLNASLCMPAVVLYTTVFLTVLFSSVQSLRHVWLFVIPWTAACQASLSITNSQSPPKPMSIESVMPSNHLILCCPLLLPPSIFPSLRVFSNESPLHIRWPEYWSFSFSISPSNEHPGLISFRMHWLDLFSLQGTLESLLQNHSSKASVSLSQLSMAPHSGTIAWKIPWTEEPGRLQSMGSRRVRHDWLPFHFWLSCIGEGNGNPLQCSCLENPRDRRAWWAAVYGVTQSRTWLKWLSSSSSFLYSPTITSIHDHWKNHSLD